MILLALFICSSDAVINFGWERFVMIFIILFV
jgi:hypothetical protein